MRLVKAPADDSKVLSKEMSFQLRFQLFNVAMTSRWCAGSSFHNVETHAANTSHYIECETVMLTQFVRFTSFFEGGQLTLFVEIPLFCNPEKTLRTRFPKL